MKNKNTEILDMLTELDKPFLNDKALNNLNKEKYLSILFRRQDCQAINDFFDKFTNNMDSLGLEDFEHYCSKNTEKINEYSDYGITALHYAIIIQEIDSIKILIKYGANIYQNILTLPHIEFDILKPNETLNAIQLANKMDECYFKIYGANKSRLTHINEIVEYLRIIDEKHRLENSI